MIPLLLCGTVIGVLLSKFLPPSVVTGLLVLYLFFSTWKMFSKAKEITKKENSQRALQKEKELETENLPEVEIAKDTADVNDGEKVTNDTNPNENLIDAVTNVKTGSGKLCKKQICNLFILLSCFTCVLVIALLRGGHGSDSIIGIGTCSAVSWMLMGMSQVLGVGLSFMAYRMNRHIYIEEDKEDVKKTKLRRSILIMSYFTGIAAGTLGIGGGMILGPFMLSLGMDPTVSTALSGFTVLFTSSSTTSQFIIAGAIHIQHAWVLMVFSLIGSFIGNLVLKRIIKKYNRPSLIIWVIFGI